MAASVSGSLWSTIWESSPKLSKILATTKHYKITFLIKQLLSSRNSRFRTQTLKSSPTSCFKKFLLVFYISYFDVMLKRNEFLWFFFSKGFGAKCKHTELALNFIQKQYFSEKKDTFPLHFNLIGTPWTRKKLLLKFSVFEGTLRP